jgi:hypothetical protein
MPEKGGLQMTFNREQIRERWQKNVDYLNRWIAEVESYGLPCAATEALTGLQTAELAKWRRAIEALGLPVTTGVLDSLGHADGLKG